ncbi:MAG: electron transport complex subunit RsxC [Granulosicoccus sp.]
MNWLSTLLEKSSRPIAIRGGLALPRNKPGLPEHSDITELEVPKELVIPLLNYHGETIKPYVKAGDPVRVGDKLAAGIIASANGFVQAIEYRSVVHPSHRQELCVVIQSNHTDNLHQQPVHPMQDELTLNRIADCGIHGLGGAGFSAAEKFDSAMARSKGVKILLINAVECEPMISCDEALMMTEAEEIIHAVHALIRFTDCQQCIFAIENDKTLAIEQITQALQRSCSTDSADSALNATSSPGPITTGPPTTIELKLLAPIYPSGAERPLIERVTDIRIAPPERPAQHGIVCINVATALATWRAQHGYPLVSRVVTINGRRAKKPTNARVRFGTSIARALEMSGNGDYPADSRIRVGGPLSGFDVADLSAPISTTSNCIAIEPPIRPTAISPCIRCSACSEVCPVDLLPQQLYWHASGDDFNGSAGFGLDSCIECGCCDLVCPSNIPLTATFRYARGALREQERHAQLASLAEQRYQQREQRQAERATLREEKRKAAQERLQTNSKDPIADALKRAQGRRRVPKKVATSKPDRKLSDDDSS